MDTKTKKNLLIYGLFSAITYIYLILPKMASLSVPVFFILQFLFIIYILRFKEGINKKAFLLFIPIFILSLNYFLSGYTEFRGLNLVVILLLYSLFILVITDSINILQIKVNHCVKILKNLFTPFKYFLEPFNWMSSLKKEKAKSIKSVILALLITFPILMIVLLFLTSADMIFGESVNRLFEKIFEVIDIKLFRKIIVSLFMGFYLFGFMCYIFLYTKTEDNKALKVVKGDIIIFNILLSSILLVYTVFVIIQFRYLFAGSALPYGISYAEYARRGFFELVTLSVFNISIIALTMYFMKDSMYINKSKSGIFTKALLIYLCIVTMFLLASSFYRMMLYEGEYGSTRLRLLVFAFLIFEAIALIFTLVYIIKPKLNLFMVYICIALLYYLTINTVPIDVIVAKRNIDRFYVTGKIDYSYLISLSSDAAPQISKFLEEKNMNIYRSQYFDKFDFYNDLKGWQSFNLSLYEACKLK